MSNTPPHPPWNSPQQPGGQPPQFGAPPPPAPYGSPQQPPFGQFPQAGYGAAPGFGPPPTMDKPQAVRIAQFLMYLGGALSLLNIVVVLVMRDQLFDQIRDSTGSELTESQIELAVNVGIVLGVVGGLIGVGLWLWMAWANGKGRSWARVTASVFFGINVASSIYSLLSPGLALTKILVVLGLVFGGVIIYLLWGGKGSNQYFETMSLR